MLSRMEIHASIGQPQAAPAQLFQISAQGNIAGKLESEQHDEFIVEVYANSCEERNSAEDMFAPIRFTYLAAFVN